MGRSIKQIERSSTKEDVGIGFFRNWAEKWISLLKSINSINNYVPNNENKFHNFDIIIIFLFKTFYIFLFDGKYNTIYWLG